MSRKKEFRTRTRGTIGQIGKKFPLSPRGDKGNLPRGLRQVTYSEPLRKMEAETETEEEMQELYDDIQYSIRMEEYNRAEEMAKRYQKLKKILEQPEGVPLSSIDRLKIALKKVKKQLDEMAEKHPIPDINLEDAKGAGAEVV